MEINTETFFKPKTEIIDFIQHRFQALPPAVQRIRELSALLSDPRLYSALGNADRIESIQRNENGYLIQTEYYTMQVNIKYIEETRFCGPAKFEFEFCQPIPSGYNSPRLQALPPGVQRMKELSALLADERLYQAFGNADKIERIERNEHGFMVYSEHYTMQVYVHYSDRTECCGPAKFSFEFADPIPFRT